MLQNESFLGYFPLSVQENLMFVYIDIINVFQTLTCIKLKFVSETINYNKVDPVIQWAQISITVTTIKFTFSFIKKLRIPRSLVWSTSLIKYKQPIVKELWQVLKTIHIRRLFKLNLVLDPNSEQLCEHGAWSSSKITYAELLLSQSN